MMPIVFNNLAVLSPVSPQGDGNLGQYISRASKPTFSILARQARPMARELENALTLPDASLKIKTEASAQPVCVRLDQRRGCTFQSLPRDAGRLALKIHFPNPAATQPDHGVPVPREGQL